MATPADDKKSDYDLAIDAYLWAEKQYKINRTETNKQKVVNAAEVVKAENRKARGR